MIAEMIVMIMTMMMFVLKRNASTVSIQFVDITAICRPLGQRYSITVATPINSSAIGDEPDVYHRSSSPLLITTPYYLLISPSSPPPLFSSPPFYPSSPFSSSLLLTVGLLVPYVA